MMSKLSGILLDCIWFYTHSRETIKEPLSRQMLEHVDEIKESNPELDISVSLYSSVLSDIADGQIDSSSKSEIHNLLLKYKEHVYIKKGTIDISDLKEMMTSDESVSPHKLNQTKIKIRNYLLWASTESRIKKISSKSWKCGASRDTTKQEIYLNDILETARELTAQHENINKTTEDDVIKPAVDFIDMTDKNSIGKAIQVHRESTSSGKVIKFGLQGLNQMFNGGMLVGEFGAFAALSHHYKTGMLLSMARWTAVYNKITVPKNTIPTIVFISLENELDKNLFDWFKSLYENSFHKSPEGLSDEEIRDYIADEFAKNGFTLLVFRRLGDEFGIEEFRKLQEELKNAGYYVVLTLVDYLQLMKVTDSEVSSAGNKPQAMNRMFECLRDWANHTGQTVIGALTLNKQADQIAESNPPYAVSRFTGGMIADSSGLKRPLNFLVFMHKQYNHNGIPYLTLKWDKRRGFNPPEQQLIAYRFGEFGILDDINTKPKYVYDIYSDEAAKGDQESGLTEQSSYSPF